MDDSSTKIISFEKSSSLDSAISQHQRSLSFEGSQSLPATPTLEKGSKPEGSAVSNQAKAKVGAVLQKLSSTLSINNTNTANISSSPPQSPHKKKEPFILEKRITNKTNGCK